MAYGVQELQEFRGPGFGKLCLVRFGAGTVHGLQSQSSGWRGFRV